MDIKKLINAAQEKAMPDLVLKNGTVLNVFTGELLQQDVAIAEGYIVGTGSYSGKNEVDISGKYLVPGFINAHLHVESSMVTPLSYSLEELRHGTTTVITDPHEIVNVGGAEALADILDSAERNPIDYYVMLPSCVPATPFEHSGAVLDADSLKAFKNNPHVLGLGEMMNTVGVLNNDISVTDKLESFSDMIIDGHAPSMTGKSLNAYVCAGIKTDHESTTYEEAVEKLRCGLAVLVREGSASKNLEAIITGIVKNNIDTSKLAFCTDDKHLADIRKEGTISHNIRKAIALGLPVLRAYQMATINAARIYGLKNTGAIACGYKADLVVLDDLEKVTIAEVYKGGTAIENIELPKQKEYAPPASDIDPRRSVNCAPLLKNAFHIPEKKSYDVIGIIKNQIVTEHLTMTHDEVMAGLKDGSVRKIAVIERHHATGCFACAYIKGYCLKHGAVATTTAHDSHNIIIIGDNDSDMFAAVKELKRINGGYVIISDGKAIGSLQLELGGLMSTKPSEVFIAELDDVIKKAYEAGVDPDIDPFITLSFMALPVIPKLRITDCGLFDVEQFCFLDE